MMDNNSLMKRAGAKAAGGGKGGSAFTRPDVKQFTPPAMHDVVDRIVAAGVRIMTSPEMRDEVRAALDNPAPVPQKLAENVTGLLLTLDQQVQGGIPMEAIFPAAMELLGEAAEVVQAAGQTVTQEDYNDAARTMFVLIGQKLGGTPEQIMGAAEEAVQGGGEGAAGAVIPSAPRPGGMPGPAGAAEAAAFAEESA
jgi:hypothetical protein